MTHIDVLIALAAVAGGVACVVFALRMTSGVGRIGLLLVLVLAVLACFGIELPSWQEIQRYINR